MIAKFCGWVDHQGSCRHCPIRLGAALLGREYVPVNNACTVCLRGSPAHELKLFHPSAYVLCRLHARLYCWLELLFVVMTKKKKNRATAAKSRDPGGPSTKIESDRGYINTPIKTHSHPLLFSSLIITTLSTYPINKDASLQQSRRFSLHYHQHCSCNSRSRQPWSSQPLSARPWLPGC